MRSDSMRPGRHRHAAGVALSVGVMTLAATAHAQPTTPGEPPPMRTPPAGSGSAKAGEPPPKAPPTGPAAPPPKAGEPSEPGKDPNEPFKKGEPDIDYKPLPESSNVTFNFEETELSELVDTIAQATGRRFIYGAKVRPIKATVQAPGKVTVGEAYQAFLSILETNGLTVIPHGRFLKIVETTGIAQQTTPIYGTADPVPDADRFVTRLYRLGHVDATEVSNVLSRFKSAAADITVYSPTNLLIITDTGSNIRRMLRIVEEVDSGGAGDQIWMQPVHYRPASEVAAELNEMLALDSGKAGRSRIIPDDHNNSLVLIATESDYQRLRDLLDRVDIPTSGAGSGIHVLPLQHAKCDDLSQTLNGVLGGTGAPAAKPAAAGAKRPAAGGATAAGGNDLIFEGDVRVTCDTATNSLLTTSSLRDYAQLRNVIDRLDQARRQVFIEAVIMDVNVDHSNQWGVGYHGGSTAALGGSGDTLFYGGVNATKSILLPSAGDLEALFFGVRGPDLAGTSNLFPGISIPAIGVTLNALARSGDSNVLATPHILATDNIPAEISIGQNIPLQTNVGGGLGNLAGLASQAGAAGAGGLAGLSSLGMLGGMGFQAQRQDVGIKLKVTPHINDSDQVHFELEEEFSDAGAPLDGNLGAIPINKRTASTQLIVRDQQTVVIGGLVRDSVVNAESKVPILGDIPILGLLFKSTKKTTQKTNLLLVLTPYIIRDQNDLKAIFERKMQERQEFLDRYFVFDDQVEWQPAADYSRTNGLLEHIRQTQLRDEARADLARELSPKEKKGHEVVKPIALPSMVGSGSAAGTTPGAAAPKPAAPAAGAAT
ncbi:MAG: type II secretion system secretin GspD, partial [Myxococcales bacterium]|nr:type II secretion system secretin GspD [Myxococcales bacterium]